MIHHLLPLLAGTGKRYSWLKKNFFIVFFLATTWFTQSTHGQTVRLGVAAENIKGELVSTDPIKGRQYFKTWIVDLKKGWGAVFFMQSSAFTPKAFLATIGEKVIAGSALKNIQNGKEATVTYKAPADTTMMVIFTSEEEGTTGNFVFGYRILDADQMQYDENYSTCDKLAYLMNHWQLDWELIPKSNDLHAGERNPLASDDTVSTSQTLVNGHAAQLVGTAYSEKLFISDSNKIIAQDFYRKICKEVQSCLSPDTWVTETERITTKAADDIESIPVNSDITHFFLKGGPKDRHFTSFKIVLNAPVLFSADIHRCEVLLIFN